MSMSTTLTLNPVTSAEKLQQSSAHYYHQSSAGNNSSNSNNNNNTASFYQEYPLEIAEERKLLLKSDALYSTFGDSFTVLPSEEDTLLLEQLQAQPTIATTTTTIAARPTVILHKSNSYHGSIKAKTTILKQDSVNGRIATSLTDSESDFPALTNEQAVTTIAGSGLEETDAFLTSASSTATAAAGTSSSSSNNNNTRNRNRARNAFCFRAHTFINRNWYLSYLVPLSILLALMFVAYLTRDYAKRLLYWIETQNPWVIFALFILLFIVVSFPIVVGYFVLMITAGYLFGILKGFPTVILGANLGIAIAHLTIRSFRHRIPMHKLIKNETGRAILRVISGPKAFKVVLFTRLTPIPFGIQNAIFGVSSINPRVYHTATFLGLLPAQTINVYLGSTLRSMHEVLNNHGTAVTGYISFGVEVICGVALMFWVVQKARKELSETLLSDMSNEGKLIDIEV